MNTSILGSKFLFLSVMMEYLIHEDCFFCVNSNVLRHQVGNETREITLDNLESKLLSHFIRHQGKTISKNELMELWNTQYVMEHSLTRVISTLRKKLDNLNNLASLIKTIPREGYQYIGSAIVEQQTPVVELPENTEASPVIQAAPNLKALYFLIATLIIALLVIGVMWSKDTREDSVAQPYVYEVMDNGSLKEDATMNPDGETLVYSSQIPGERWSLKIVSLNSQFTRHHKVEGYDLISPAWIDEETLVYVMSSSDHCSIRKIDIYKSPENNIGSPISSCNVKDPSRALVVLDSNTLLVSDSEAINIPKQLIKIDIDTGEKTVLHKDSNTGTGAYRLFVSPNKDFVATLSSDNWFDTDIQIFKATELTSPIWHKKVDYPLFSVSLGDDEVVYKDETGRFKSIDFLSENSRKNVIPLVITRPVYSPTFAKNGFFFTEGDKFNHRIVLENFSNGEHQVLNEIDSVSTRSPLLLDDGQVLLYASNQTGINQIWQKNLVTGKHEQISSFDTSYHIEGIVVNEAETEIAVETNRGIIFGEFDVVGKIVNPQLIRGSLPAFWQGDLLYSLKDDGKSTVYQYVKESQTSKVLLENGAYKTVIDAGKLYYSKYHASGIWQYNEAAQDTLIYTPNSSHVGEEWDVFGNHIYMREQKDTINKVAISDDANQTLEVMKMDCIRLNIVAENKCLFSVGEPSANRLLRYSFD